MNPKIPPFKFTTATIKQLPANQSKTSTELEVSDTESKGLKCLIGRTGNKRFLFRYSYQGKKCSLSVGSFPEVSIGEARNIVRRWRELLCCGIDPKSEVISAVEKDSASPAENAMPSTQMTLSDFFWQYYLPYAKQHKRSWNKDEERFRCYIESVLGHIVYAELKAIQIHQLQADMLSGRNYLRAYAPGTCNRAIALLKTMGNLAYRLDLLPKNEALKVPLLKENNQRERYFSKEEMQALIYYAQFYPNKAAGSLIALLLLTGARRNELQQAQWRYLDVEKRVLYVPHTKSGKPREIYFSPDAMTWLTRLERYPNNPYIFARPQSTKPISAPRNAFAKLLKQAGIKDMTGICFHTARHSVASLLISSGKFNLYDVKAQLAHASLQSSQRYAKLTETRQRETGEGICALLTSR